MLRSPVARVAQVQVRGIRASFDKAEEPMVSICGAVQVQGHDTTCVTVPPVCFCVIDARVAVGDCCLLLVSVFWRVCVTPRDSLQGRHVETRDMYSVV